MLLENKRIGRRYDDRLVPKQATRREHVLQIMAWSCGCEVVASSGCTGRVVSGVLVNVEMAPELRKISTAGETNHFSTFDIGAQCAVPMTK
jgi:hypothetical protein